MNQLSTCSIAGTSGAAVAFPSSAALEVLDTSSFDDVFPGNWQLGDNEEAWAQNRNAITAVR